MFQCERQRHPQPCVFWFRGAIFRLSGEPHLFFLGAPHFGSSRCRVLFFSEHHTEKSSWAHCVLLRPLFAHLVSSSREPHYFIHSLGISDAHNPHFPQNCVHFAPTRLDAIACLRNYPPPPPLTVLTYKTLLPITGTSCDFLHPDASGKDFFFVNPCYWEMDIRGLLVSLVVFPCIYCC